MIYLYLFGTCFHFIYVFMIIGYEGMCNWGVNNYLMFISFVWANLFMPAICI